MANEPEEEEEDLVGVEKKTPDELGSVVILLKRGWNTATTKQLVDILRDTANFLEGREVKPTADFDLSNFNPGGKAH